VNPPPLKSAALSGPINEAFHLIAVFPHEVKEFGGIQSGGFGTEKGLEPPAQIWGVPRIQAITASNDPVVTQHLPHLVLRIQARACTSSKRLASHRG
jgi:hypothetical protein